MGVLSGNWFFRNYHITEVETIINNKVEGATMFSSLFQGLRYWKMEDGLLHHTSAFNINSWVKTKFSSVEMAKRAGVVDIYNFTELEKAYSEHIK